MEFKAAGFARAQPILRSTINEVFAVDNRICETQSSVEEGAGAMPRHCAPNHPDCFIDCPAGGFAYYILPYGPCTKGCDPDQFADRLEQNINANGWFAKSCGMVIGVTGNALSRLAGNLLRSSYQRGRPDGDLERLSFVGRQLGDIGIDADWYNAESRKVIEVLLAAAPLNRAF